MAMEGYRGFLGLLVSALLVGFLSVIFTLIWVLHYREGLGWDGTALEFNWHPVLVVTGFVFIQGIGTGTSWEEAGRQGPGVPDRVPTEWGWAREGVREQRAAARERSRRGAGLEGGGRAPRPGGRGPGRLRRARELQRWGGARGAGVCGETRGGVGWALPRRGGLAGRAGPAWLLTLCCEWLRCDTRRHQTRERRRDAGAWCGPAAHETPKIAPCGPSLRHHRRGGLFRRPLSLNLLQGCGLGEESNGGGGWCGENGGARICLFLSHPQP